MLVVATLGVVVVFVVVMQNAMTGTGPNKAFIYSNRAFYYKMP